MQKILLISIALLATAVANAQAGGKTVVKIEDKRNVREEPRTYRTRAELARHKHHDVEVFRVLAYGKNTYDVTYYQEENGSMSSHGFMEGLDESYTKAEYEWVRDTVCVRFFNEKNQKSKLYRGYGCGKMNGLLDD